jgi:AcrR family transcriptional regulator
MQNGDGMTDDAATVEAKTLDADDLAKTHEAVGAPRLALLDAGMSVIIDKGFARATIEDIAERAGVAPDVFYAHFPGKGALLRALNERFVEQMMGAIDETTRPGTWRGADPRELIMVAVKSIIETVLDREGLVRAFLAHGATDTALSAGLRKIGAYLVDRLLRSLSECAGGDRIQIDKRAASFTMLLTVSIVHHDVLVGNEWSGVHFTRDELVAETARAVFTYLGL